MRLLDRITTNPAQMGGVPCVRSLRIPVATVLRMLAGGQSADAILAEYPDLGADDIRACRDFEGSKHPEKITGSATLLR